MDSNREMSARQAMELVRAGLAALAACDFDSYGPAGLGEECAEILHAVGALQLEAARRLARFTAAGGPAYEDSPSPQAWLGRRCRLRPWEAKQLTTIATRLHLLDDSRAAYDGGEVEFGDVATIAEGVDRAADTMTPDWTPERIAEIAQPILLEAASKVTPGQLRKVATRIAMTLDGDGAERRRRQAERQSFLDLGQSIDGVGTLRGDLGAADFAILEKTVDAFAPRPEPEQPRWRNAAGHRRLQGLLAACEIALNAAGRHGYRERGGAPVRVHLIASTATVDTAIPATQAPPGRTEYGTIVSASEIREMLRRHRSRIDIIHIDGGGRVADRFTRDGQPLNWGRTRRLFSSAQRDAYLTLYAGCAADGCDRPLAWADIDHRRPWADGGATDLDNGQPLCRWHHVRKELRGPRAGPRGRHRDDHQGPEPPSPD